MSNYEDLKESIEWGVTNNKGEKLIPSKEEFINYFWNSTMNSIATTYMPHMSNAGNVLRKFSLMRYEIQSRPNNTDI